MSIVDLTEDKSEIKAKIVIEGVDNIEITNSDNNNEDEDFEYGELELTKAAQWERVYELFLILTTIMIFNVSSLISVVFALTWTNEGKVINKVYYKYAQETIGM